MAEYETIDGDWRTIDPDTLVDIRTVEIDTSLPPVERYKQFKEQVKTPSLFKVGKVVVKLSFTKGGSTFQETFEDYLTNA